MELVRCDCGKVHFLSDKFADRFLSTYGKESRIPVGNLYGCWLVPRLFLVFHSDNLASRLRSLASLYGWDEFRVRF